MEVTPTTISKDKPSIKSMDYDLLREEGLKYIQKIAGKIWTDYNTHDPGLTILEVLCYTITDLGYRTSYDIKDILTQNPNDPDVKDIKNFFTAGEILPSCPVTINDYRKLMIDVEVYDPSNPDCDQVGVKNAWIEKAQKSEIDIYVDKDNSELVFDPINTGDLPLDLKILHNVLLEFNDCPAFGDLNENKIDDDLTIIEHIPEPELEGLIIRVEVEFPRWDDENVDWNDNASIREGIIDIQLDFLNRGDNFDITFDVNSANEVILSGTKNTASGPDPIDGINEISVLVNDFIYNLTTGLIVTYKKKIAKIIEIVDQVKITLHANRNLCEDYLAFSALRIEEILVCADIEIEPAADVENVQAEIYHEIGKFLSPTVNFYTLEEMFDKCHDQETYEIKSIQLDDKKFTVEGLLFSDIPEKDSTITIIGSNNNDGVYTIAAARTNPENELFYDLIVNESIPSDILTEGEELRLGDIQHEKCMPVERIFEGPRLKHGFIDDDELSKADRKKVIHVSDLIQIIMDVPGVIAVKSIQIANVPQDNEDGAIPSLSVKWCLSLAYEQNYVPRLNINDSKITFYKDQLPFQARQIEVEELIDALEAGERPQKNGFPLTDIIPPKGEYKDIEDYYSLQNEFPLVYGIGEEGLPESSSLSRPTEAQARQLKGYLMFFDQLIANYLSQLSHVKDLFSMNAEKDEFGNYEIGRTYYTQVLADIVPEAKALYVNLADHEVTLNEIAESSEDFAIRRNKFLDHLIARFAEQFADYALLSYRLNEAKASTDLIEDKLAFLNAYPKLSSRRGKAFDYNDSCNLWHVENVSGLEQRAALLVGVDGRKASTLNFNAEFVISGTAPSFDFTIENSNPDAFIQNIESYESEDKTKELLEKIVVSGVCKVNYRISGESTGSYFIELLCNNEVVAESTKKDFTGNAPGEDADQAIDAIIALLTNEFYNNPESNRHNLACPLLNYFSYSISSPDMVADPPTYEISYELNSIAFETADPLLTGLYSGIGEGKRKVDVLNIDLVTKTITVEGNVLENLNIGDPVSIFGSDGGDGDYTIDSFVLNGDDTDIVVNEAIASDAAPLGQLGFNVISEAELTAEAEAKVHDVLWAVVYYGVREDRYLFDPFLAPYTSPYKFQITDPAGNIIGESVAFDFNQNVAAEIMAVTSGKVIVQNSMANDNEYDIVATDHKGPDVEVQVSPMPASTLPDGDLSFTESFVVKGVDKDLHTFVIESDLTDKLQNGNAIEISNSTGNDNEYTLFSLSFDGTDTTMIVKENIPSDIVDGDLSYTKTFVITGINGDKFLVKGGADDKAVEEMIKFLMSKFFDHEGLHIIEHILLRPKINELLFVDLEVNTLNDTLGDFGNLSFIREYDLKSADSVANAFIIDGDITLDLSGGLEITIRNTPINNGQFTISSFSFDSTNTIIVVDEQVIADVAEGGDGILSFSTETAISTINALENKIVINGNFSSTLVIGAEMEIIDSEDEINDGLYTIMSHNDVGTNTEIIIDKIKSLVQDALLPIILDENCECTLEDPYTCIAHVVLPFWPGRFINKDFKKFFEKTLKLEAPAHVFLNICWVSCAHMAELEIKYKSWLVENSKENKDKVKLSRTLGELIDILGRLRNVYPVGTLHDCDEDENLENSIILDNSVLGEI